jgi:lipopolysaccharide transport system ATP-binding protein
MKKALEIKGLSKVYSLPGGSSFKALDQINLELKQGEVLGLIGANGAGKSTLLKILSRITPPSAGRIEGYGKMSSLLEVGTGFHPELSGRDNIYLNGSILGMSRSDIRGKFDEIVAFAGVEKFLDLPVKRYSSGMYVRLAFAVAAHLQSDILLIDEVLAVGDAAFQKRCLGRMGELSKEQSRSIIFVSHNMSAVNALCDRVVVLEQGQILSSGEPQEQIDYYLQSVSQLNRTIKLQERKDREGDGRARWQEINFFRKSKGDVLQSGQSAQIELSFDLKAKGRELKLELHIFNTRGNYLSSVERVIEHPAQADGICMKAELPALPLMPGDFFVNAHLYLDGQRADFVGRAHYFKVIEDQYNSNEVANQRQNPGFYLNYQWSL